MGMKAKTTVDLASNLASEVRAFNGEGTDEQGTQRARALALVVALGAVVVEYGLPLDGVIDVLRSVTHLQRRTTAKNAGARAAHAQQGGRRGR